MKKRPIKKDLAKKDKFALNFDEQNKVNKP
jgi:hypothetical protein